MTISFFWLGGSSEGGFFPQRARKGAAVLTARTSFGMTGSIFLWEGSFRETREEPNGTG